MHENSAIAEPAAPSMWCIGCGYVLDGLPASRCPECGRDFDLTEPRSFRSSPPRSLVGWSVRVLRATALAVGLLVIFGSFLIMLEWILIRHTMELAAQISIGDSKQRVDSLLGVPHSARTIRGMTSHRWKVSRLNLLAKPIFIQIRFAEEGRVNSIQTEKQTKTWRTPERISAGHIVDYASTGVYDLSDREIYIVHGEQNRLFAMSASCSHLHCTVFWLEGKDGVDETFKDPCHGCIFDSEGVNIAGAAPRPLERFKISRVGDRIVVDKTVEFRGELDEWDDPDSFLIFEP